MIRLEFSGTIEDALMTSPAKTVDKAVRRALERSLNSTRTEAARSIARETKIKVAAIQRAIKVKRPYGSTAIGWEAQIQAREGDIIPLSGSPYKMTMVSRTYWRQTWKVTNMRPMQRPVNTMGKRRAYQRIEVKFYGKTSFQYIPGAFRAVFKANGGRHIALAMRRSNKKRLPLREMFTKYPDVALWLIEHEKELSAHAAERLGKEFQSALEFYKKQEAKKFAGKGFK
jgi:hypothetical protein